jgi:hypothetical protein
MNLFQQEIEGLIAKARAEVAALENDVSLAASYARKHYEDMILWLQSSLRSAQDHQDKIDALPPNQATDTSGVSRPGVIGSATGDKLNADTGSITIKPVNDGSEPARSADGANEGDIAQVAADKVPAGADNSTTVDSNGTITDRSTGKRGGNQVTVDKSQDVADAGAKTTDPVS